MKAEITGASAYKRNDKDEIRVDVKTADGQEVSLYHSPRESNVNVTRDFVAACKLTRESFGKDNLHGTYIHVRREVEDVDGQPRISWKLAAYQAEETVLDAVFPV